MIIFNKSPKLRIGAKDALKALNELTGWEDVRKDKQSRREKY